MTDLTPRESATLRTRILEGAEGLPPRRNPSRIVAVVSAVAVVGAIAVGSVSIALGSNSAPVVASSPTPTTSATRTPAPTPAPTPSPTPAPTQTPAPTPTQEPVVLDAGGDIVSSEQWDLLYARGWGYYFFAEQQRYVATDPSRPLPAEVTADIQRRMDAIPNNNFSESDMTTSLTAAYDLGLEASSTGKTIVTIRYNVFSVPGEPNGMGMRWYARSSQSTSWWMPVSKSRDQLVSDVNAWIAANTTAGSWVVFVGPGVPDVP